MIISEEPPFILFSLPKTGTSSMDAALSGYFDESKHRVRAFQNLNIRSKIRAKRIDESWNIIPRLKHATPIWIRRKTHFLCDRDWKDYFKACFIRNPLDRLVSVYSFRIKNRALRPGEFSRDEFRKWLLKGGSGSARMSMKNFVTDNCGRSILDFIGHYENLSRDWNEFIAKTGIPPIELPHIEKTRTNHPDWKDIWTPELMEIFMQNPKWKTDYEFFGYDSARQLGPQ